MILNGQYGKGGTGGLLPRINVTAPYGSTVTVNGNPIRTKQIPNPAYRNLPSGYTQVESITGTGTQYINTGKLPSFNSRVVVEMQWKGTSANQYAFGTLTTNNGFFVGVSSGNHTFRIGTSITTSSASAVAYTTYKYDCQYTSGSSTCAISTNGSLIETLTNTNTTQPYQGNAFVFGTNFDGSILAIDMVLLAYQHYTGTTLDVDLVPCYNSSNVYGVYDLISNTFITTPTGAFTGGAEVAQYINELYYNCPSFGTYSVVGTLESQTKTESVLIDACQITNVTITY